MILSYEKYCYNTKILSVQFSREEFSHECDTLVKTEQAGPALFMCVFFLSPRNSMIKQEAAAQSLSITHLGVLPHLLARLGR